MKAESATPEHIFEVGFAFRKSKTLLSAVELGLFSVLGERALDSEALVDRLGLHGRGARDFFDALVALKLLGRDDLGRYTNTPDCALYLDRGKPTYIGGVLEYLDARVYSGWGLLTQALRTGTPQSGPSAAGGFATFYSDKSAFDIFLKGMTGGSLLPAKALAAKFPWHSYKTVIDIGTAQGCVPVEIARAQPHLTGGGFDLPLLEPAFRGYVSEHGLSERLKFYKGDFFQDPLPRADVLIMGRVLHDWDLPAKKLLLTKAYEALPPGGALIVHETFIDPTRRDQAHALLASLNMLIQTAGGFESTSAECMNWMREAGFGETRVVPLSPTHSAVIGIKPDGDLGSIRA